VLALDWSAALLGLLGGVAAGGVIGMIVGLRRASAARALGGAGGEASILVPGIQAEVLDRLPMAIVRCDDDGIEIARNTAAGSLGRTHAGVLIDEAIGRHLQRAIAGAETHEVLEFHGPPSQTVVVRAGRLPSGGAVALVEDVSERRRIDAVRTDFVANISHELKTPVGAIAVLADALVEETDAEVIRRMVARMLAEAERAARTIDDLLELSEIELGGSADPQPLAAADLFVAACERIAQAAEQRGVSVITESVDSGTVISGDQRQIVSALANLVDNSVKYSESGGEVRLRARRDGHWVELEVADRGLGIPAREIDRIFERFYRVDKARSRGTGGTGLGLAIVRHVVTNHGGEVRVRSSEGEGSTFTLRLPAAVLNEEASMGERS